MLHNNVVTSLYWKSPESWIWSSYDDDVDLKT